MNYQGKTIDEYITDVCLFRNIADLVRMAEAGPSAGSGTKSYWVSRLILDALADQDIQTMDTIVGRIDGLAPTKENREGFANYLGSALSDVMEEDASEIQKLRFHEPVIVSMAKCVILVSLSQPGKNPQKRRAKNMAIEMILTRTGGRQNQPVRNLVEKIYQDPDWMKGSLPEGEDDEQVEG